MKVQRQRHSALVVLVPILLASFPTVTLFAVAPAFVLAPSAGVLLLGSCSCLSSSPTLAFVDRTKSQRRRFKMSQSSDDELDRIELDARAYNEYASAAVDLSNAHISDGNILQGTYFPLGINA